MIFVERDEEGKIIAVHRNADKPGLELKTEIDAEVMEFMGYEKKADSNIGDLVATDFRVVRILEDLIDLLVRKNIIMFTELPEEAQKKLKERQQIRQKIGRESIIVDNII